jgi:hypothetical protein
MTRQFHVLYPDDYFVDESTILSWATDDISNGDIEGPLDAGLDELVRQMNSSGNVTLVELTGTENFIADLKGRAANLSPWDLDGDINPDPLTF